ncbi:MAG: hypothetical protein R2710_06175 [Acidimicrobiales bacterium]
MTMSLEHTSSATSGRDRVSRLRSKRPHPAQRARRIAAVASGLSMLGITAVMATNQQASTDETASVSVASTDTTSASTTSSSSTSTNAATPATVSSTANASSHGS